MLMLSRKALATKFTANGVKVALGSRSGGKDDIPGSINVKVDVTKPSEIRDAFAESENQLGGPVNIVVYNGRYNIQFSIYFTKQPALSGTIYGTSDTE